MGRHAASRPVNALRQYLTLKRRQRIYAGAVALAALLAAFGIITSEQSAAIIGLAAVVLGVSGLALANPTRDDDGSEADDG